jgi:uncharacterized protein (TIGR02757 family)
MDEVPQEGATLSRPLPRRLARVRDRLDALLGARDPAPDRAADPVSFVHAADPEDRELVGLVAAFLAFGQVTAVRGSIARVLDDLGPSPSAVVDDDDDLDGRLGAFVHRVYRGPHLAGLLRRAGRLRREEGSLGRALAGRITAAGDFREGLARWSDALRGEDAPRGLKHLVPDPRAGSACKRTLLYLRWMVRPADGVDLGLWEGLGIAPSALRLPLDTHVHRISRNLGLTERKVASWAASEEITATLRRFDPADPVKYDFAICHLGVSRDCPSRRDEAKCSVCVLKPACRHWKRGRR